MNLKKMERITQLSHAHFINSATAGLHLAFKILKMVHKWEDGDEVITTPLTFVSTNHAILYENLHAVFADVDDQLCLDPIDVEKKITKKPKRFFLWDWGEMSVNMRKLWSYVKT